MPIWLAAKDEGRWAKAKQAARDSYPELTEDDDRYWAIVTTIFKKMGGKARKKSLLVIDALRSGSLRQLAQAVANTPGYSEEAYEGAKRRLDARSVDIVKELAEERGVTLTPSDAQPSKSLRLVLKGQLFGTGVPTIYMVRHGKTLLNGDDEQPDLVRGWLDPPLDEKGKDEAHRLAKVFHSVPLATVYSSDLKRSEETAKIIAAETSAPIQVSRAFRPWNLGHLEGSSSKQATPTIRKFAVQNPATPLPHGESFEDFKHRFLDGLKEIMDDLESGKPRSVIIVTHYRNLKLAHAWAADGGKAERVDLKTFLADDMPTGYIGKLAYEGGKWRFGPAEVQIHGATPGGKKSLAAPTTATGQADAVGYDPLMKSDVPWVEEKGNELHIRTPYHARFIQDIRGIPGRRWDPQQKVWVVGKQHRERVQAILRRHFVEFEHPRAPAGTPQGGQFVSKPKAPEPLVEVRSPSYNVKFVRRMKEIPRARWDPSRRAWLVPESARERAKQLLDKYFPATESALKPGAELEPGQKRISKGEGYGGREFQPGETIAWDGEYYTVVSASKRYVSHDGMSMGVGADSGYIYSAVVRPATEEEKRPLIIRRKARAAGRAALSELSQEWDHVFRSGTRPRSEADRWPKGERVNFPDTERLEQVGGGKWFVLTKDRIWAIRNNRADGDDWGLTNCYGKPGSAGAIGAWVKRDKELELRIRRAAAIANASDEELERQMAAQYATAPGPGPAEPAPAGDATVADLLPGEVLAPSGEIVEPDIPIAAKPIKRLRPGGLYVLRMNVHPLSYNEDWTQMHKVVSAAGARRDRPYLIGEYEPSATDLFRLETPTFPKWQPRVTGDKLAAAFASGQADSAVPTRRAQTPLPNTAPQTQEPPPSATAKSQAERPPLVLLLPSAATRPRLVLKGWRPQREPYHLEGGVGSSHKGAKRRPGRASPNGSEGGDSEREGQLARTGKDARRLAQANALDLAGWSRRAVARKAAFLAREARDLGYHVERISSPHSEYVHLYNEHADFTFKVRVSDHARGVSPSDISLDPSGDGVSHIAEVVRRIADEAGAPRPGWVRQWDEAAEAEARLSPAQRAEREAQRFRAEQETHNKATAWLEAHKSELADRYRRRYELYPDTNYRQPGISRAEAKKRRAAHVALRNLEREYWAAWSHARKQVEGSASGPGSGQGGERRESPLYCPRPVDRPDLQARYATAKSQRMLAYHLEGGRGSSHKGAKRRPGRRVAPAESAPRATSGKYEPTFYRTKGWTGDDLKWLKAANEMERARQALREAEARWAHGEPDDSRKLDAERARFWRQSTQIQARLGTYRISDRLRQALSDPSRPLVVLSADARRRQAAERRRARVEQALFERYKAYELAKLRQDRGTVAGARLRKARESAAALADVLKQAGVRTEASRTRQVEKVLLRATIQARLECPEPVPGRRRRRRKYASWAEMGMRCDASHASTEATEIAFNFLNEMAALHPLNLRREGQRPLTIRPRGRGRMRSCGALYWPDEVCIEFREWSPYSLPHEFGHYLAHQVIPRDALEPVIQAVRETPEYQLSVLEIADNPRRYSETKEYWTRPSEIWARAYEQWVVYRLPKTSALRKAVEERSGQLEWSAERFYLTGSLPRIVVRIDELMERYVDAVGKALVVWLAALPRARRAGLGGRRRAG